MERQRKELYTPQMKKLAESTRVAACVCVAGESISRPLPQDDYDHVDGVGSKAKTLKRVGNLRGIVLDALRGNLNDLAVDDAIPSTVSNVIVSPEDDDTLFIPLVAYLAEECHRRGMVLTGGDPDFNREAGYVEMFITIHGYRRRKNDIIQENRFRIGDVIVGLVSTGPHCNGFSLIRHYFGEDLPIGFLAATADYYDAVMRVNQEVDVHARVNITGTAFVRPREKLPPDADIFIHGDGAPDYHWPFHALYERMESRLPAALIRTLQYSDLGLRLIRIAAQGWRRCLRECGSETVDREIYSNVNCGTGFLIGVDKVDMDRVVNILAKFGIRSAVVGEVTGGSGKIHIKSKFSNRWFDM